jgi:hypothetical protein
VPHADLVRREIAIILFLPSPSPSPPPPFFRSSLHLIPFHAFSQSKATLAVSDSARTTDTRGGELSTATTRLAEVEACPRGHRRSFAKPKMRRATCDNPPGHLESDIALTLETPLQLANLCLFKFA